ncbi:hypothetical protein [Chitinophaga hostae]|uniref:Uncharacterized protein n=1 Tax=Chitinophaga hostae TaxID=2831022 RepID=A0ABS5JB19_9BACT|nr:hypothetical protein [Chitinophaga hostae]MBS0032408.1 hypothetical protein [Chitinophaga hostae]
MYMQSFFHGLEYQGLICTTLGWHEYTFRRMATDNIVFEPAVKEKIIQIQMDTLQTRIRHVQDYK